MAVIRNLRCPAVVPNISMSVIIVFSVLIVTFVQESARCFTVHVMSPLRRPRRNPSAQTKTLKITALHSFTLTTALESLWEERLKDQLDYTEFYEHLTWISLQGNDGEKEEEEETTNQAVDHEEDLVGDEDDENDKHRILPLYPLPAVYVPTPGNMGVVNHTLVNIEPQNIKMALDLLKVTKKQDRQFCVVLRAVDSGRIASVGTIISILNADIQLHYHAAASARRQYAPDKNHQDNSGDNEEGATTTDQLFEDILKNKISIDDISRIRLTCSADSLVEITSVLNTDAFSPTNRIIYKSDEYLRAKVRTLNNIATSTKDNDDACKCVDSSSDSLPSNLPAPLLSDLTAEMNSIIWDYSTIRTIYQLELGSEDFPARWLAELGNNMPTMVNMTTDPVDHLPTEPSACTSALVFEQEFWSFVQEWLSVCLTLRQGLQAVLSSERNELMIEAASAKGGPLKLPIHIEDLDPHVRLQIQRLECDGQEKLLQMGIDPVLDFQVLISQPTWPGRVRWLKMIVERERTRLEGIASRY